MSSLWANITSSSKSFLILPLGQKSTSNAPEEPRSLPSSGFTTISSTQLVEEEELPDYQADRFYPVQVGEIFHDRYQIVAKLGFGSSSTTWLARELIARQYVALKVYVHTSSVHREVPCYQHITRRIADSSHQGRNNIRRMLDSFGVNGPHGKHIIVVFEAAQMSLRDMRVVFRRDGFDEDFVKGAVIELLHALYFLHLQGEVVHTDIHPGNMLLGIYDNNLFKNLEEKETTSPVPRKPVSPSRTIYLSRLMRPKEGPMLLSDFGEARIGPGPHGGDIMPLEYRAPETLLYVGWSYPVGIWSIGLTAWDLLEPKKLFTARDEDGDLYDAAHFAQLIATYIAGNWLGLAPIPEGRTMEALETRLEDNSAFLRFIRRALTWMPEKRATAKDLLQDPRLTGKKA
ncbi:kinase-like protein [Aspergillus crustosus]